MCINVIMNHQRETCLDESCTILQNRSSSKQKILPPPKMTLKMCHNNDNNHYPNIAMKLS